MRGHGGNYESELSRLCRYRNDVDNMRHDDDVMMIENETGKPRSSFQMMDGFCNIP